MTEQKLISTLLSSRESYQIIQKYLAREDVGEIAWNIYEEITKYYEKDNKAEKVDKELLLPKLIKRKDLHELVYEDYLARLPEASSASNLIDLYIDTKKDRLTTDILMAIHDKDEDKLKSKMEEYLTFGVDEIKEEVFNGTTIEELESHFTGKNLIPIFPTALSELVGGGVPRQSQLCVIARPDVGKSTFTINAAVGAAEQGFRVLYIGNEDPAPKMVYRIITRFVREPESTIRQSPKEYFDLAIRNGYGNVFFVPMHPGNIPELRKWIERVKPDIVVIDQIRNMNIKKDSMTINLEQGCIATRNLAKEFNLVMIVVTQAGDSARNKLQLDMEDVEWSNTGVAAQMDLMIGIGQTPELKENQRIMLSFPKNKLSAPIKAFSANIEYGINRIST